jgi:hypothetical protein
MGAWGIGNFENDAAGDWEADFRATPGVDQIQDAFAAVRAATGYMEVDEGGAALAAAEVVAAAAGKPCRDLPPELREWAEAHPAIATASLKAEALAAIAKVMDVNTSEFAELRAEGGYFGEWAELIEDLKRRLA